MADYGASLPPAQPWELTWAVERRRALDMELRAMDRLIEALSLKFEEGRKRG